MKFIGLVAVLGGASYGYQHFAAGLPRWEYLAAWGCAACSGLVLDALIRWPK